MNNSQIVGIIICGPQGCGKTSFVNNLLEDNKFIRLTDTFEYEGKQTIADLYDLDAIVIDGASKKTIHNLKKLPNMSKIRLPFTHEGRWMQRPLILVETNIPFNELPPTTGWFEVIQMKSPAEFDINDAGQYYSFLKAKIFQFILSKTK